MLCCILYYIDKTSLLCCILYYCIDKTSLLCYILYYCIDKTSLLNKLQTLNLNIVRPFYTLYTLHSDTILCNFTKTNKQYIRLHTNSTVYTIISFGWQTRSNFNRYNLTLPSPPPLSVNFSYARKWAFLILHDEIHQEPPNFCL